MATKAFELKKHIIKFDGFKTLEITPKQGGPKYIRDLSNKTTIYIDQGKINFMVLEGPLPTTPVGNVTIQFDSNFCEGFRFEGTTLNIIGVEDFRFKEGPNIKYGTHIFDLAANKVELEKTVVAGKKVANMKSDKDKETDPILHTSCP